ncbi:MAG: hypothetical protein A2268_15800 [Candidatus Raymondbacteria bacterium RifOxyA12_full_50_37]|uniref:Metallo-beta-lactamase domain-containing protein n=1 Tax=Candidatus Raymondbacteria bacterium RIFOXYD12_FULL_49_13 TaxID=1817890 RepID=A0A1F7FJY7_UNCRA|nr:MAG: hypothetical protein A2268_15800 [Candidatus Raymondbacteria bacterium RifOxyA12_full_50_37]OGJ87705.1 MAG: hypothetical protein A2248_07505 [Candidatus Raymondbacteria bacterium RIFOXYA2_FULL_49_16]OGJ96508.1 MAG: hypothetical protein A2453_00125 [Candidatus Raymondbacteria bacterium RIFOXYC2_FULL_50_21]OGJ99700.1 MAG: hypothetical protein A2487_18655 [Candidatus Raymondbacteria bacterium RifOxyC12_full_50_8]OGK06786.1 MAG: hypothetical protein A2519_00965 [Candidatus Raymondbacteria b
MKTRNIPKIIEGVYWVGCGSWGGLTKIISAEGSGNVFCVGAKEDWALVDAGTAHAVKPLLHNLESVNIRPQNIRRIVLTHSHADHVTGAGMLVKRTRANIAASTIVAKAMEGDEKSRNHLFMQQEYEPLPIAKRLTEGDIVKLGPYNFSVMLTPGHIPGSITLFGKIEGVRILFTGDTAIGDQGDALGVTGWLDGHWHSNPKHLLKSIERIRACNADIMLPGHGFPIRGKDKVKASLEHCAERIQRLLTIPNLDCMFPLDLDE